jgi:hypothetical protein
MLFFGDFFFEVSLVFMAPKVEAKAEAKKPAAPAPAAKPATGGCSGGSCKK